MALVHFWWVSLRSEFCCPSPGPGGSAQVLNSENGTGRIAFGTGSGSVNGDMISGLTGNFST